MNSYQRLKVKNLELEKLVKKLKLELESKGNVFFVENKWLGCNKTVMGLVVDGETIRTSETIS